MKSVFAITALLSVASVAVADDENPWATYPSVAKTASINGFADKIYADLPSCAQECVKQGTGMTPCPYWDTGCLCVMPQFGGLVAECIVENCKGNDVVQATSLATSICSSAGVWEPYWFIPASLTTALDKAAETADAETTAEETSEEQTETVDETTTSANETTPVETGTTETDETTTDEPTTTQLATTAPTSTEQAATTETQQNEADAEVESEADSVSEELESAETTSAAVTSSEVAASEESATSVSEVASTSALSVEQANIGANNYPGAVFGGLVAGLGLLL